jgi:two-component system, OmpR family, sensor histidine kinase BaeS
MVSEIDFMTEMVRSLSVYSRINLPDFNLKKALVSPSWLIEDAVERYADVIRRKGVSFINKADGSLPPLMLDREQMVRVMNNLLDNALQHCSPGGEISLGVFDNNGKTCFYVTDTGDGVPEAYRGKIFEPLFRVDPSRSRDTGGVGLGLAICKKIVELHGGEIFYEHDNGLTTFSFRL